MFLSLVLSLGGLAGPVKAARSCVRVSVWVIRSPETLRVCVFISSPSQLASNSFPNRLY